MALVPSLDITKPKIEGPMIIPLKISPITEGQQICSKSSPIKSAATSIIRISEIIEKAKTTPQNRSQNRYRFSNIVTAKPVILPC